MSTELEMIYRLREERNQAQARALEYAKWGETLHEALLSVLDTTEENYTWNLVSAALAKSEREFNYKLFCKEPKDV